jgi:hypothetical protein
MRTPKRGRRIKGPNMASSRQPEIVSPAKVVFHKNNFRQRERDKIDQLKFTNQLIKQFETSRLD